MEKQRLGVCLLWNKYYHGVTANSSRNIRYNWMFEVPISVEDFYENNCGYLNEFDEHIHIFLDTHDNALPFTVYRQYNNIKIDILKVERLEGQEDVAIIKTCWIKFIQRKWKRLCQNAKLENQRPSIKNIICF